MNMISANKSSNETIGLIQDLKVTVAECDFYLQVQVIENAPYGMLLGRPFLTLTEANTRHFLNGDSQITLLDPNTNAKITIPTKPRKRNLEKRSAYVGLLEIDEPETRGDFKGSTREKYITMNSEINRLPTYYPREPEQHENSGENSDSNKNETNETKRIINSLACKEVADRTRPIAITVPEESGIMQRIPSDPLVDLPVPPTSTPDVEPGEQYTKERKEAMPVNNPIPPGIHDEVVKVLKHEIKPGIFEPSNSSYRSRWFPARSDDDAVVWIEKQPFIEGIY